MPAKSDKPPKPAKPDKPTKANKALEGTKPPKTKKRRSPIWTKLVMVLGCLLVVAGGGAIILVDDAVHTINKAIPQKDLLGDQVATNPQGHVDITGAINILLVGLDTRPDNILGTRSDTIIIAHIPASHDQIYLASIPRDTEVPIPAFPKTHFLGDTEKINGAFQHGSSSGGGLAGGFQLLAATIKLNWKISFQAAVLVNFSGFTDIVRALGTVRMYVDVKTTSIHHGFTTVNGVKTAAKPFVLNSDGTINHSVHGVTPVVYTVGYHDLTAYEALDYVRQRDGLPNADYDRERHQQQFIAAVLKELYQRGLNDPTKLSSFIAPLGNAFTCSCSNIALSDWIFALKAISPAGLIMIKTNNGTYNTKYVKQGGLTLDEEVLSPVSEALFASIRTDTVSDFLSAHPDWIIPNHSS